MQNGIINNDQQIAKEILNQLGGNKFLTMTGSKNLAFDKGGALQMHLTRNKSKAKYLRIELTEMDTYIMTFTNYNKNFEKTIEIIKEGVYCDTLQETFTNVTGLYTKF